MRVFLTTTVLAGVVLMGFASLRTSAQGQSVYVQAGLTSGEKVNLSFDSTGAGFDCTVIEVRGDFVGCRSTSAGMERERWYNLHLIERIERPARQQ